jgi:hypothetical protein
MNVNLVLAAGFAYTFLGALIMFLSYRALYRRATGIVAGYPRVLSALRAQKDDARFGLIVLVCGNLLQIIAACGYTIPLEHWPYPTYVAVALLCAYGIWRCIVRRRAARAAREAASLDRPLVRRVYETRRSIVLVEAARREAANRRAREQAKAPRDRSVVYVRQEWECRWWSDRFGVTPEALRAAVRQVGPMVVDIERYFALKSRLGYAFAA